MREETPSTGALIRQARQRARLTQAELGNRAGVTQSVVSAYEAGARQPSLPMLSRLVRAAGMRLDLRVERAEPTGAELSGPLGRRVREHRQQIVQTVNRHGGSRVRVFGSVARGQESANSDIDLLVDLAPESGLLELGALQRELRELLGTDVDVVPARDLKAGLAAEVLSEAVAL